MKKRTNNYIIYFFLFMSFTLINSCDDIIDCIIQKNPVLNDKDLKAGILNEFYSDYISAEIENEPNDDSYTYYFFVSGNLPDGLESYVDNRKVVFEGVPLETGTFEFKIELNVGGSGREGSETNGLCADSTSKKFTIIIN